MRVVFGVPVFGKAAYLEAAIDSLLAQTFEDFAVVLIDDRSEDDSLAVAERLAARDPRVTVHVNERRLGMLENTRRALTLPLQLHPETEFWALGSDHDLWHPTFLERLIAQLEAHPEAVLAYPQTVRIDEHGDPFPGAKAPAEFATAGIADPAARMAAAFRGMSAGNMIYGLFRARDIAGLGHYRPVLVPDRLLLSELALRGTFVQEPQVLWERRFRGLARLDRQRMAFWPDGPPRYARTPWWLQHTGALLLAYGFGDEGARLGLSRGAGVRLSLVYLKLALAHRFRRRLIRLQRFGRRNHPARRARGAFRWFADRYGPAIGARLRELLERLQANERTRGFTERTLLPRFERLATASAGQPRPGRGDKRR